MGLIFDSSVLIDAERRGETIGQLLKRVIVLTGDQQTALSAVALWSNWRMGSIAPTHQPSVPGEKPLSRDC